MSEEVTDEEYMKVISDMEKNQQKLQNENLALQQGLSSSAFSSHGDYNSIQFQLETETLLSDLEHLFRGDKRVFNEETGERWVRQKNKDLQILNDHGVSYLLSVLAPYIEKSTSLSYFTSEQRIYEILADLGEKLADDFFCTYEKMGLDTPYKKVRFGLLVKFTLDKIEVIYRRALRGETMKGINTSQIYSEINNPRFSPGLSSIPSSSKKRSFFNPSTWFG